MGVSRPSAGDGGDRSRPRHLRPYAPPGFRQTVTDPMDEQHCVHLIAYVRTSKVTDWKRIALLYGDAQGPAFVYRSDNAETFGRYAKDGTVLWVIESHKDAPPSLVARLEIVGQVHARLEIDVIEESGRADVPDGMLRAFEYGRKLRWYAVGDRGHSRFFGYNDVSRALLRTDLEGEPAPWRGHQKWSPKFGQSLQGPRRIKSGIEALKELADTLARRSVFLSWKHRDFAGRHDQVEAVIAALVAEGIDCWWDQRALPASRALARLTGAPDVLERLLDYGLDRSRVLLALGSKHWGSPSSRDANRNWTRGEWDRGPIRFAYEIDGPPEDGWPDKPTKTFPRGTPVPSVARQIADHLANRRG